MILNIFSCSSNFRFTYLSLLFWRVFELNEINLSFTYFSSPYHSISKIVAPNIFTVNFDTKANANFDINVKAFGVIGERNSVGFTAAANVETSVRLTKLNSRSDVAVDESTPVGAEITVATSVSLL